MARFAVWELIDCQARQFPPVLVAKPSPVSDPIRRSTDDQHGVGDRHRRTFRYRCKRGALWQPVRLVSGGRDVGSGWVRPHPAKLEFGYERTHP